MRRVRWCALMSAALLLSSCGVSPQAGADGTGRPLEVGLSRDYTGLVNPFVGTQSGAKNFGTGGGAGNTYPGAAVPFGMLQFSPNTAPSLDNWPGGYSYGDHKIDGFGLTRISGAGCGVYGDIPIMPTTVAVTQPPAPVLEFPLVSPKLKPAFQAGFDHADEQASPGYYQVLLNPNTAQAIDVQLTATPRTGMARFGFPAGKTGTVLINANGSSMPNKASRVTIDPQARAVSGSATSGCFCFQQGTYTLYFYAEFQQAFTAHGTWQGPFLRPGATTGVSGGAYLSFDTEHDPVVQLRVGISYVSVANARANLQAENPGWDFAAVRQAGRQDWNQVLNRVEVRGESPDLERVFYTALYHAALAPSLFSDVNGDYLGMDGAVHQIDPGHAMYASYSGWDIYRSQIPLLAMLFPDRTSDMMQSLVLDAQQSAGLPKWAYANVQTEVMVGDPADLMLASAYALGVRGFDTEAALQAMLKGATQPAAPLQHLFADNNARYVERPGLALYQSLGYLPYEINGSNLSEVFSRSAVWGTSATTLAYALEDFAIDRFARALGQGGQTTALFRRSANWKNIFNRATGYIEPKLWPGLFVLFYNPASDSGFVEGSAAQYSWFVPHDMAGLIAAMGGRDKAAARLDEFFTQLNAGPNSRYAYLGDEPTLFTPWIYAWLGQPDKTGPIVHKALTTLYADTPGGMPGNDDLGTMSAWWVLSSLGLAPVIPGTDTLLLNAPMFSNATVHLPGGDLDITASGAGDHVQNAVLNGAPLNRAWLLFSALARGATLHYDLGTTASNWAASDMPPSPAAP